MAKRINAAKKMLKELLDTMSKDNISTPEKILNLKTELAQHYKSDEFLKCKDMGAIVKMSLKEMIRKNKIHFQLKNIQKNKHLSVYKKLTNNLMF